MALEVEWSRNASEDLNEIIQYLEENWTDKQIRRFCRRLEDGIDQIQSSPERAKDSPRKKREQRNTSILQKRPSFTTLTPAKSTSCVYG